MSLAIISFAFAIDAKYKTVDKTSRRSEPCVETSFLSRTILIRKFKFFSEVATPARLYWNIAFSFSNRYLFPGKVMLNEIFCKTFSSKYIINLSDTLYPIYVDLDVVVIDEELNNTSSITDNYALISSGVYVD